MVSVMTQGQSRMKYCDVECGELPVLVSVSHFRGHSGVEEYHLMVRPTAYADIATQAAWVNSAYLLACASLGLEADTGVFRRVFCSDLPNQAAALKTDLGDLDESCAVSWVSQPPVPPAKVALWAYHVNEPGETLDKRKEGTTLTLRRGALSHCWTTGITSTEMATSRLQTEDILTSYEAGLRARGLNLADHVLRTWFFVQNVDANYQGLVTARKDFFATRGLTPETHYIASTGIEGRSANPHETVMMDAYAIAGVHQEQIRYLAAPDHLCPTHRYGVTFERGVSVAYQDRQHVLISGTASIDNTGSIVHPGNVEKQLERTLENVRALLHQAGATFNDVCMHIVYVRDPSDTDIVLQMMQERFSAMPMQVVVAPVCRPGWLVEIECEAIVPAVNPSLPAF
ncbi:MAG: Rid family hydrolase [Armatimonadota bacterium]